MSAVELLALSPFFALSGAIVLILIVVAIYRSHALTVVMTALGLILAFASLPAIYSTVPLQITPLLTMDGYAVFFMGLLLMAGLVVTLLSYQYLARQEGQREEYYILLLLAALGSTVIVASNHFASFFLGLEILSVSLYALIAYTRKLHGLEAAIKYLILAATSDALLLFGMALIYAETGSMEFSRIASAAAGGRMSLLLPGTGLFLVGLGFKVSLVPFHMWTPDVYQGAPAPVTGLLASVSKGAVFVLMLRYFSVVDIRSYHALLLVFTIISVVTMFVGNLLALMQNRVKRILAYSSIAHFGYLLVLLLAPGELGIMAAGYYLVAYFVTILGAFGVISLLAGVDGEPDLIEQYQGLGWNRPWLAGVFTAMLLSLAGIPLTAGFVGKFYVVAAGIGSTLWLLVISLVVSSVIGLFYYLRVIAAMFATPERRLGTSARSAGAMAAGFVLAILTLGLVWLGIYPAWLIDIMGKTIVHWT
jgi:NADH-quinone oxidoreductase subunit N